jgi:hypothetical protein
MLKAFPIQKGVGTDIALLRNLFQTWMCRSILFLRLVYPH